jgi:hypothetical protein
MAGTPSRGLRKPCPRTPIGKTRREIYLRELANMPVKARAARIASEGLPANYPQGGFRALELRDPVFAEAVAEAIRIGFEKIEEKAMKLALGGGRRPIVTGKGEVVAYETIEYPQIILKLLASGLPERYREKTDVNLSGEVNVGRPGAVEITAADLAVLPASRRRDFVESLRLIADARAGREPGAPVPIDGRALPPPAGHSDNE